MRALLLDSPGPVSSLRIGEAPEPQPGPGQVRIQVRAAALNPADYAGLGIGLPAWQWPRIPGIDAAGVIDAVGPGVDAARPGERVAAHIPMTWQGSFAEKTLASAEALAPVPDSVGWTAAGALVATGLTAHQALTRRLRVQAGQTVLVAGGAGGVGGFAVQIAHHLGARVIATASAPNHDYVRSLGADEVVDYTTGDVAERVRDLTGGRGVDTAVDTVGPESVAVDMGLLVYGGGVAAVAGAPDLTTLRLMTGPSIHQIALGAALIAGDAEDRASIGTMLGELLALAADGSLDVEAMVRRTVGLDGVPGALAELQSRHGHGKIVYLAD